MFVNLNNGETAVVIGRTADPRTPLVASIKKPDGNLFLTPRRRNTAALEFAIRSASNLEERLKVNPANLWGVAAIRVNNAALDLSSVADLI